MVYFQIVDWPQWDQPKGKGTGRSMKTTETLSDKIKRRNDNYFRSRRHRGDSHCELSTWREFNPSIADKRQSAKALGKANEVQLFTRSKW